MNVLAPGYIESTGIFHGRDTPAFVASKIADTLVGRPGMPADVAAAIGYIASPDAGYLTGQIIGLNGVPCSVVENPVFDLGYGGPVSVAVAVPEQTRTRRRPRLAVVAPVAAAVVLSTLLLGHRGVPGSAGSGVDSALPWLAAPILALLGAAVLLRRPAPVAAALAPALIWGLMFGPNLADHTSDGWRDLRVASLNLGPADAAGALAPLLSAAPDLLVLQEVTAANRPGVAAALADRYPYRATAGTVALYSRYPLSDTEPVDIRIGWTRALRTTVTTPAGQLRVYAAHLASARAGMTAGRNRTLAALAGVVHADPAPRLLLAGDLNTATTDRQFTVLAPLTDTQQQAGAGFGFTWPARLPLVRPDHLLQRGLTTRHAWVVTAPGSDHRAVLADLDSTR